MDKIRDIILQKVKKLKTAESAETSGRIFDQQLKFLEDVYAQTNSDNEANE